MSREVVRLAPLGSETDPVDIKAGENGAPTQKAPDPKPLPASLSNVPPFDPEMLPESLRGYVIDTSQRLQCPPEYCAVTVLVLLAGLIGHKVRLKPKQHDDWEIVVTLWAALIGGPSAMKSPALKAMRFPIDAIEADGRRQYEEDVRRYETDKELEELARAEAKKKAKGFAAKGEMDAARTVLESVEEAEPPPAPMRLTINDATVEKAGELMNAAEYHLTILRDELAGWLSKMQQEEYASDRAFYLEAFNGDGRFTYDRIGRGTVAIERCALNIVGGIQPSKLAPIVRSATKGTTNDGLIQRFQLAVWPDAIRHWKWIDRTPATDAKEQYRQTFYRLHSLEVGTDEEGNPPSWRFTPDAQAMFVEWATEINLECRDEEMPSLLAEHLLKMPKTVGSLALLFAVIDGEQGSVGEASTARALEWADFLRSHAERLYSAALNRDVEGAKLIIKRREKLPSPFKAKQLQQRGWSGLDTSETVQAALSILVEHGYLSEVETPTTGRPSISFWWHSDYLPNREAG
ncbi:YfjI family protein [Halomonas sp. 86]|uniref:YfjI family protein n=1 Tax=unclassified Halomonas TaxID=2609666 RepID=UPI004033D883